MCVFHFLCTTTNINHSRLIDPQPGTKVRGWSTGWQPSHSGCHPPLQHVATQPISPVAVRIAATVNRCHRHRSALKTPHDNAYKLTCRTRMLRRRPCYLINPKFDLETEYILFAVCKHFSVIRSSDLLFQNQLFTLWATQRSRKELCSCFGYYLTHKTKRFGN